MAEKAAASEASDRERMLDSLVIHQRRELLYVNDHQATECEDRTVYR